MNNAHHRRQSAVARCLRVTAGWSSTRIPGLARIPRRNAVLGVAGLAILGGAIAGPVAAASGPTPVTSQVATALPPEAGANAQSAPLPSGTASSLAKKVVAPFEMALAPDFRLQPNGYYCGPAATRIAISAHTAKVPSFDAIARLLGTTTSGTNSAMDTTRGLNHVLGTGIYHTRMIPGPNATAHQMDLLRTDMVRSISNGYAAVTNIVGGVTDLSGGWHSYDGGHYVSVIGYGQGGNTMKIADPADTQGDGTYWVSTINLAKWMVTRGYSVA